MDHPRSHRPDGPRSGTPRAGLRAVVLPAAMPRDEAWALVAPFRSRLIGVARSRGLSLPDAQDVAHHVMCRAVERGALDPERIEAHLVRAAVSRCHDVQEEALREEQVLARTRGDDRLVGRLDDAVCDRAQVHWLLAKLPARERRVVELSVAGETVTGIAEATGLSYPTVDRLLSRARKEMRRLAAGIGVVTAAAWRHRRVAAPAGATVAAVAVATVSVLGPHSAELPAERGARARSGVARVAVETAVRRPAVPRSAAPPAAVTPAGPAPVAEAGPQGQRVVPLAAPDVAPEVKPDEHPVRRIEECLKNGVHVELGSRTGVVCDDGKDLVGLANGPLLCVAFRSYHVAHLDTRPFEVCLLGDG